VLRIAFSWSARFGTLPALSQRFASGYPDVTVVTQEMWNADMPRALRSATIDLAISLCPERDSELAYELLRRERVVALTPEGHPLAGDGGPVRLPDLADEELSMFPRELAPRLHDAMLSICRAAGVEPRISPRAFHSAGDTGTLIGSNTVALAPESVSGEIPGVHAAVLADENARLETFLVWHPHTPSIAGERFRELARDTFAVNRDAPRITPTDPPRPR
jgi:DNA-binding transcriptional LysR family regulator